MTRTNTLPDDVFYAAFHGSGRHPPTLAPSHRDELCCLAQAAVEAPEIPGTIRIHAFCWTANEIRLAIEGMQTSVVRFLQQLEHLHRAYLHGAVCHGNCLFAQRDPLSPVRTRAGLIEVVRHIHLAPVRTGLAADAAAYPWSSLRTYLGLDVLPWVTTDAVLELVAPADGDISARARSSLGAQ